MSEPSAAEVVRALHARDPVARALGIELGAVEPQAVEATLVVGPQHLNAHGLGHGGILFTLADSALQYASNAENQTELALAAEISFVRPARAGARIVARCEERARAGRTRFWDVTVRDAEGETLALFRGQTRRVSEAGSREAPGRPRRSSGP